MLRRILFTAFLFACATCAQGLRMPQSGWLLDPAGSLRPLLGFAGNFVLGPARDTGVISAASSGTWTLAKTHRELIVFNAAGADAARVPAPEGRALFSFTAGGEPAAVYFPESGLLMLWSAGEFASADWQPGHNEEVLGVCGAISFFARRGEMVWRIDHDVADGRVTRETALPGVRAPLLPRPDGSLLYADGEALVLRASQGSERRIELPGAVGELSQLADGWVGVLIPDRQLAVSFSGAAPATHELPGGAR